MYEVGRILYGSNNYMLNGPESDKDYKVFLCPNFIDLYNNKRVEKTDLPEGLDKEHFSPIDVRIFIKELLKGNINCCEFLFSTEKYNIDPQFASILDNARELFKEGYLVICWDKFFASMEGMMKNSFNRYDVNRKTMSRAYYFYMLSMTIIVEDFSMTEKIWRGNNWNNYVHDMRFNENIELPTKESLERSLEYVKNTGKEASKRMQLYNPNKCSGLIEYGEHLQEKMKQFVAFKIINEIKEKEYL